MIWLAASPLFKMFYSSLIAGVGIALVFSLGILGAVRSSDLRRAGRRAEASAYAALAACAFALSGALVIYGLVLVAHKS